MSKLYISEKFYSIQGEGRTTGYPSIFLRLSGCNILCQSSTWICDTIEVWKKGIPTNFEDVFSEEEIKLLRNEVHLVVTGGEPLMHQKRLSEFLNWFKAEYGFKPYIEVETNGTIEPIKDLVFDVNQWNVSPKLKTSGVSYDERFKPETLLKFNKLNSSFKFVVSCEEDVLEIFNNYRDLKKNKIYLMPAGDNQELLNKTRLIVIELCKKYILKFTDRIHIVAWDKKTGV